MSTGTGFGGFNMYAYCENNPVMFVDPSGGFLEELYEGVKEFFSDNSSAYAGLSTIALIDGPLRYFWEKKHGCTQGYYHDFHINNKHGAPHIWYLYD